MTDWTTFLSAMTLALVRVSGMVAFAPFFSSTALPMRAKAVFVGAVAFLLAPLVATLPHAHASISFSACSASWRWGWSTGSRSRCSTRCCSSPGRSRDCSSASRWSTCWIPASAIQTPLLGDLFQLMGTLVVITAGLDRILLASMVRSFRAVPLGSFALAPPTALAIVRAAGGIFLAAVELAAPVLAATMLVEIAVALLGKLSPQLPVMMLTVPLKTLTGFAILTGSLALWPRFIEARFAGAARYGRAADRRARHRAGWEARPMPGERTEQATQHRREKARKEGDLLHSRELSAAAGTLAGVIALGVLGGRSVEAWRDAFAGFLALGAPAHWEPATLAPTLVGDAAADALGAGAAGGDDGGGGRGGAGGGHRADRRRQRACRRDRIQAGPHQSRLTQCQEPVLAARRGAAGQIAHPGSACWRSLPCSASPAQLTHSAVFDCAAGAAGPRMSTACCWPRHGCSSPGRRSITWSSGRAASRA